MKSTTGEERLPKSLILKKGQLSKLKKFKRECGDAQLVFVVIPFSDGEVIYCRSMSLTCDLTLDTKKGKEVVLTLKDNWY